MSRKEVPRAGLVKAALAGKITNQEGATALQLSVRQFQRLKRRYREGGVRALLHRTRGQPSPRRLPPRLGGINGILGPPGAGARSETHARVTANSPFFLSPPSLSVCVFSHQRLYCLDDPGLRGHIKGTKLM